MFDIGARSICAAGVLRKEVVAKTVLLVMTAEGSQELAAVLSKGANVVVEIACSRRAALSMLRRHEYAAVLLDTGIASPEVTTAEDLWRNAGSAIPLEVAVREFRATALMRLLRHLLLQCDLAKEGARRDATAAVEQRLRSALTGLMLQSDLLLRESAAMPALTDRVQQMRELTQDLRLQLH